MYTDFNKYCYIESNSNIKNNNLDKFNFNIITKLKTVDNIINELLDVIKIVKVNDKNILCSKVLDPFSINIKLEDMSKYKINYT